MTTATKALRWIFVAAAIGLNMKCFADSLLPDKFQAVDGTHLQVQSDPSIQRLTPKWGNWIKWGDQGNGVYNNPVIPADYSDIDCIRVGPDYYAISSTFQFSPGVIILHSKDLVNWEIAGHAVSDITQIGPEMNWDKMSRYGRGIWAGAIRFHDQKFWIYFGTPDEGYFVTSAPTINGPWSPLHCVMQQAGWDDCCPFWDDDGQGYLIGTHFSAGYQTCLFKLTPDGQNVVPASKIVVTSGFGREANKLYKIDGWYYHLFSQKSAKGRAVLMQRSKNIRGPYSEPRQLNYADKLDHEPNQGGLVQTVKGNWYFFTHHGTMDWEGRPDSLLPVTWIDGWPIIGQPSAKAIGSMVWSAPMPVPHTQIMTPQTSDNFQSQTLAPQWEWNYQPRSDKWAIMADPPALRLYAFQPLIPDDLLAAGNTLTQRSFRTTSNVAVVCMDITGMADGQKAGLAHMTSGKYAAISVVRTAGNVTLEWDDQSRRVVIGPQIGVSQLWLKSVWGLDGVSRFSYSLDGAGFTDFGPTYQLKGTRYRGDRLALYTYNDKSESGFVDFNEFNYTFDGPLRRPLSTIVPSGSFTVPKGQGRKTGSKTAAFSTSGAALNDDVP